MKKKEGKLPFILEIWKYARIICSCKQCKLNMLKQCCSRVQLKSPKQLINDKKQKTIDITSHYLLNQL